MGVPAFFRWLSRKYPAIIVDAVEEKKQDGTGERVPVDATQPNLNYQEFDNLYLDMNGIIHPCTHPEDRPAPKTEEEMFILIFQYIDRLFSIVRPRRLLYMAIDGVAPRAKMNQQRSRRFRASKEAADKKDEIAQMRKKLAEEGVPLPPPRAEEEHFDSNCITPGTPFMHRLAVALRYYIHLRVTTDPAWQKIQVILSDASAPGEGEHKIMDYIRRQRASPSHDPNTVHCLCGADADLIMLGLATHEVNFNIIREEFVPNQPRACELCGQYGHEMKTCRGLANKEAGADQADPLKKEKNFIFIRLPVLREYLERELQMPDLPFEYDFERAIDDWVFMCFFVGNDFLPHLPSLEIREGAIDRLIKLYKNMVYDVKGWLTHDGDVHTDRVQMIMTELGKAEDEIFRTRYMRDSRQKEQQKARRRRERAAQPPQYMPYNAKLIAPQAKPVHLSGAETRKLAAEDRLEMEQERKRCEEATAKLKAILIPAGSRKRPASDEPDVPEPEGGGEGAAEPGGTATSTTSESDSGPPPAKSFKEESATNELGWARVGRNGATIAEQDSEDDEPADDVKLHEAGWKDRYYQLKFGLEEVDMEFRRGVAWAYVEGLCWVMRYYYQGCASWEWYYPHHYAPFASDFDTIADYHPKWPLGTKPFNPLEQLMSVFPAASREHIPVKWRPLMTNSDSPIIHYYPTDFMIDLNGKKFAWQGVALLPFVDAKLLLESLKEVYGELTEEEKRRNVRGPDRLFVGMRHPLYEMLVEALKAGKEAGFDESTKTWIHIDPKLTNGMAGEVAWDKETCAPDACYPSLFQDTIDFTDVKVNKCLMVDYRDPQFPEDYVFPATHLPNAKEVPRVLKPGDWDERRDGAFRPQIGFARHDGPRAHLSGAGHRTLDYHAGIGGGGGEGGGGRWRHGNPPVQPLMSAAYAPHMPPPPFRGGRGGGQGGGYYYNSNFNSSRGSWNDGGGRQQRDRGGNESGGSGFGRGSYGQPPHHQNRHYQHQQQPQESWRLQQQQGGRYPRAPDPSQIPQPLSFSEMAMGGYQASFGPSSASSGNGGGAYQQQQQGYGQYADAGGGYQATWGAPAGSGGGGGGYQASWGASSHQQGRGNGSSGGHQYSNQGGRRDDRRRH